MASKRKKVYFVNPAAQGNTVWAKGSKGHEDGKYVLDGCGQQALRFLYEEVGNTKDVFFKEMTADEIKLMEAGEKRRKEMSEKSAKAKAKAEKDGAKSKAAAEEGDGE